MKAITLKENGGVENLTFAEIATPKILSSEVLIKVKAIGINPVDAFVRQSPLALKNILQPENGEDIFVLGWDVSGTIVEVGAGVKNFKPGDDVFGMVNFKGQGRAYAEYVAAPENHLALKPSVITHDEAAAATLAALTAWQALVTHGKIKKGEKVVIHSAAGGVGHYAVQIAKHFGTHVIAIASATNRNFVLGLGADEFIDYTSTNFEEIVTDADLVLDSITGDHILRSIEAVRHGGRIISLLTPIEGEIEQKAKEKEVFALRMTVVSDGDDMKQIASLLEKSRIKSHISGRYSFNDLPVAHKQIETRKTIGKIVVSV